MPHTTTRFLLLCLCILTFHPVAAAGADLTLAWDPPDGPSPAGYRVRYGPWPGAPTDDRDAGASTRLSVTGLVPGTTYEFHVVAYDQMGLTSGPSNRLRVTVPAATPTPTPTTETFPWAFPNGGSEPGMSVDGRTLAYLAEGVQSQTFTTRFAVANPWPHAATATLYLRPPGGRSYPVQRVLPPFSHADVEASAVLGGLTGSFGLGVEATATLGVSRTTTWNDGRGGHAELATTAPSPRWYFAEGATHGRFELFYLVFNPGASATTVMVTYMRAEGPPLVRRYPLGPGERLTLWVDQEARELAGTDVGAIVETIDGRPIVAERAMYLSGSEGLDGGHVSLGLPAARTRWLMAEGATGRYFTTYVLLVNPSDRPAQVVLSFRRPDGLMVRKQVELAPFGRVTLNVAEQSPLLADSAVWTEIVSMNGVPVVAERAMWWPGPYWTDGHVAAAASQPAARWLAVGGQSGGARQHATYVLLANTDRTAQPVRLTVLGRQGPIAVADVEVPGASRYNVDMAAMFPRVTGTYSVLVEALGGAGRMVVEQATYWDAVGQRWAAGVAIPGVALQP